MQLKAESTPLVTLTRADPVECETGNVTGLNPGEKEACK